MSIFSIFGGLLGCLYTFYESWFIDQRNLILLILKKGSFFDVTITFEIVI